MTPPHPSLALQHFSGYGQALSLHNLGSDLLELILARVPAGGESTEPSRRRCSQVPRCFEALTYATANASSLHVSGQAGPPRKVLWRLHEMERAALSAHLTTLELGVATPWLPVGGDEEEDRPECTEPELHVCTAAAVPRRCGRLFSLCISGADARF